MRVQDIQAIDDDELRDDLLLAARGGSDDAARRLFFWSQWHKIDTTRHLSARKKTMLLAEIMKTVEQHVNLTFVYGK